MNEETIKGETVYRKNKSQKVHELTSQVFDEMLEHVKILSAAIGTFSEFQIKDQFRNLPVRIVEDFLSEAIQNMIIKEMSFRTFTLLQV